ncbi:MAG: RNA polymerase sigma factor [Polyangiaceae bacterium]
MSSDEALFEKLIAGDLRAFDLLYARHARPLSGFIRAYTNEASEVEDLLHETFMTLLRQRSSAGRIENLRAWLYTVARNLCSKRARSRQRAGRAAEALRGLDSGALPSAEEELGARQRVAKLEHALRGLPAELAEVYRLRSAGLSYEEVANVLAIPIGTVKWRVHEMVAELRKEVER